MRFWKKHGINILLAFILCGLFMMGFAMPYLMFWLLYLIIPLSVYIMHRYAVFVSPILTVVFGVLSFFFNHSNIYLFFVPVTLAGQLGLYFALKCAAYRKGVLITLLSVAGGIILAISGACIIAGERNFPSLLNKEIMRSENDIIIVGQAKAYFKTVFVTEEEEAMFTLPPEIEIREGSDPKVIGYLYAYGNMVESSMNYELFYYLFGFAVMLSGACYLIGNLLIQKMLRPSYFLRPEYPVINEIKTDETDINEMHLPKRYLLITLIPVILLYLLSSYSGYIYAVFRASYQSLIIAPFALSGVCFLLHLAKLTANKIWFFVAVSVIIILILLTVVFSGIVILFALMGLADYVLNTRQLIKKLFD